MISPKSILSQIIVGIIFLFVNALPTFSQERQELVYSKAAVVSASQQASDVGAEIMKKGGNAIDAAVAVQFALAVTYPRAGNIGGGGFMIIRLKHGEVAALDYREKAPEKAHETMFLDKKGNIVQEASTASHLSVGVPGTVDGMIRALEKYGTMPLDMVLIPAIKLAKDGFTLTYNQALTLNQNVDNFTKHPSSTSYFIRSDGQPWKQGDTLIQTDLAESLERIARFGREGFYSGKTADLIVKEMESNGGLITLDDLSNYQSVWRTPLILSYKNYELITMPPPSSGGIAMGQILHLLSDFKISEHGYGSAKSIHLKTEAERLAFSDRAYFLGDPDFAQVPTQILTSPFYLKNRKSIISTEKATLSSELIHGNIPSFTESTETTHYSVVDSYGNAASVTTTLNGNFGSKIAVNGAGFLLNNEMDDFSIKPGEPNQFGLIGAKKNAIEAGKRPLSSMSPTIVTREGALHMVLGAAGGPRIITSVTQVFLNVAEFGMNIQQAVTAPRVHHQWLPDQIYSEPFGISPDTHHLLQSMGHQFSKRPSLIGRVHAILIDENSKLHPAWEPRGPTGISGF